jgi:hypothetical protein
MTRLAGIAADAALHAIVGVTTEPVVITLPRARIWLEDGAERPALRRMRRLLDDRSRSGLRGLPHMARMMMVAMHGRVLCRPRGRYSEGGDPSNRKAKRNSQESLPPSGRMVPVWFDFARILALCKAERKTIAAFDTK